MSTIIIVLVPVAHFLTKLPQIAAQLPIGNERITVHFDCFRSSEALYSYIMRFTGFTEAQVHDAVALYRESHPRNKSPYQVIKELRRSVKLLDERNRLFKLGHKLTTMEEEDERLGGAADIQPLERSNEESDPDILQSRDDTQESEGDDEDKTEDGSTEEEEEEVEVEE